MPRHTNTPTPMRNPSREKMKVELQQLREQVVALEETLRQQRVKAFAPDASTSLLIAVQLRSESECENRRLRAALRRHLVSRRRLLQAVAVASIDTRDIMGFAPQSPNLLHDDFGYRFRRLQDAVDHTYVNLSPSMVSHHKTWTTNSPKVTQVVLDGSRRVAFETRETSRTESDFDRYCTVLWHAVDQVPWSTYRSIELFKSGPDTKLIRLYSDRMCDGELHEVVASLVIKRFFTSDNMVIVWQGVTSLDDFTSTDVYIEETGYTLYTKDCAEDGVESVVKTTNLLACPRVINDEVTSIAFDDPKTRSLLKLTLAETESDSSAIREATENMLIEECMAAA